MNDAASDSGMTSGDDERGAQRQQEDEQHERDEQRALGEVVEHRVERGVDELGAIVERRERMRSGRNRVSLLAAG